MPLVFVGCDGSWSLSPYSERVLRQLMSQCIEAGISQKALWARFMRRGGFRVPVDPKAGGSCFPR